MRTEDEDFLDDFEDHEIFSSIIRPPVMSPLSDEYYEVYFFFMIIFIYFLFSVHLGVLSAFVFYIFIGEFDLDTDDDDDFAETEEMVVDSIYTSGFELGDYQ
jgi:hypothetical protein